MRIFLTLLLSLLGLILTTCLVEKTKKKDKIVGYISKMIISVIFGSIMQIVMLNTVDSKINEISYSLYYISIDFVLYYFILTTINYTYYETRIKSFLTFVKVAIGIDTIFFVLNLYFHFMFSFTNEIDLKGNLYLVEEISYSYFDIHLFFMLFLIVYELYILIHAIFHINDIYKNRYIYIAEIFLVIVSLTILYAVFQLDFDYSIIGYNILAITMFYLAVSYKPSVIVDKMLAHLVTNEFDSIIFFDNRNNCVFMNEKGKEMFGATDSNCGESSHEVYNFLKNFEFEDGDDLNIASHSAVLGGKKKFLEIEYKRIMRGRRFLGSYYRIKDKTDYKKALDEERYLANHDHLTGLYNEEFFYKIVAERLQNDPLGEYYIVATDIKRFKLINDIYGKKVGDQVLVDIAETIRKVASKSTIYCRIAGDKFCLLINKNLYTEEKIIRAQETVSVVKGKDYPVITHVGVYAIKDKTIPVSVMVDRAFLAISENKDDYHTRIVYYDDKIKHLRYWEQKLSGELEAAIMDGQLKVFLQPQCDKDGKVMGAEALIRWIHPTEGMIPPSKFIEMFEKNGMISRLDKYVWQSVAEILKRWKLMGKENLYISVNISPIDFYFMNIYEEFKELITENHIDPKRLKLEITESSMMRDMDRKLKLIEDLRKLGFIMEMDDFGSGYSSLNMLKEIPVDIIKLDLGFLYKTKDESKSYKIIEMIVNLSKELGMFVVSEGVETKEQLEFLSSIGCECFQGYYFSKPIEVEEFEKKYLI